MGMIASILAGLGVIIGFILNYIAKEEIEAGQRNLLWLYRTLILGVVIWGLFLQDVTLALIALAWGGFTFFSGFNLYSAAFAGTIAGLSDDKVILSLVFLAGIPRGSLFSKVNAIIWFVIFAAFAVLTSYSKKMSGL